jgi:hypothetical protein
MGVAGWAFRAAVTAVFLLPCPGLVSAVSIDASRELTEAPSSTREFAFARRHLRQSFDGYGPSDVLAGEFGVVALSHFAAGLMNVYVAEPDRQGEVKTLLDEVVLRARHPRVAPGLLVDGGPFDGSVLDDHNLYFSHLAVILGIRRIVAAEGADEALQSRLVRHLRERSLASPLFHARSYPDSARWPADQAVTLLALRLYDEAHGSHLLDAPLVGYLATMRERTDPATRLFQSSVSPELEYATIPRGCAASWTTLYLAQVAPDVAREQYGHYREHMSETVLGFGGFREWPAGRSRGMDADSGPIVFGVGVAATGLGLGPARLFGDLERYTTIRRSALTFGVPSWIPSHGYVTAPVLGEAILFHGRTARPWFGSPAALAAPVSAKARSGSFSGVSLVLLLAYAGLLGAWGRRILRARK